MDRCRIVAMLLTLAAHLVRTDGIQRQIGIQPQRIKCFGMQPIYSLFDILQSDTAHTADGTAKILINDFLGDTHSLKDPGALVRLDRGDTHLGSDLYDTGKHCVIVIVYGCVIIFIQHIVVNQLVDRIERQIRVDRAGTEAEQGCEMMHLSRFAGL